jgi:predicted transport protein
MTNSTQTNGTSNQESLTIAKYITKKTGLSFNDIVKQIKRSALKLELNVETFESLTSVLTKPVSTLVNFTYIGEVYAFIDLVLIVGQCAVQVLTHTDPGYHVRRAFGKVRQSGGSAPRVQG